MEGKHKQIVSQNVGEQEQMVVDFREVDPFNLWVRPNAFLLKPLAKLDKYVCMLYILRCIYIYIYTYSAAHYHAYG